MRDKSEKRKLEARTLSEYQFFPWLLAYNVIEVRQTVLQQIRILILYAQLDNLGWVKMMGIVILLLSIEKVFFSQ
jgi:hypothetical protein